VGLYHWGSVALYRIPFLESHRIDFILSFSAHMLFLAPESVMILHFISLHLVFPNFLEFILKFLLQEPCPPRWLHHWYYTESKGFYAWYM